MAIALTADRFGHRRLVVLGTALSVVASLLGALAAQHRHCCWSGVSSRAWASSSSWSPSRPWCCASPTPPTSTGHDDLDVLHAGRRRRDDADRGRHPAGHVVAVVWLVAAAASLLMLVALLLRAVPRHELDALPAKRRPILHEMAEVATSGGPLAIARLLRRLFLLLVRHRRLPADPAGRAPGLLDLDGRDRHGRGDRRERRRQPRGRLAAAARRAARRVIVGRGDLDGVLRRRHLRRRRARPVAAGAGRRLLGGDRRRARLRCSPAFPCTRRGPSWSAPRPAC